MIWLSHFLFKVSISVSLLCRVSSLSVGFWACSAILHWYPTFAVNTFSSVILLVRPVQVSFKWSAEIDVRSWCDYHCPFYKFEHFLQPYYWNKDGFGTPAPIHTHQDPTLFPWLFLLPVLIFWFFFLKNSAPTPNLPKNSETWADLVQIYRYWFAFLPSAFQGFEVFNEFEG